MQKTISLIVLFYVLTFAAPAHGQMMGASGPTGGTPTADVQGEEAEGKAVWDKLQNKEVVCKDLTDDDFDVLADFFMGNMMGSNHEAMNNLMSERLGEAGEKQMHVAMGKRLSGCDTGAALPDGSNYFMPMMGGGSMMTDSNWSRNNDREYGAGTFGRGNMMSYGSHGIFGSLLSLGALVFLVLGSMFFWKGIKQKN